MPQQRSTSRIIDDALIDRLHATGWDVTTCDERITMTLPIRNLPQMWLILDGLIGRGWCDRLRGLTQQGVDRWADCLPSELHVVLHLGDGDRRSVGPSVALVR